MRKQRSLTGTSGGLSHAPTAREYASASATAGAAAISVIVVISAISSPFHAAQLTSTITHEPLPVESPARSLISQRLPVI